MQPKRFGLALVAIAGTVIVIAASVIFIFHPRPRGMLTREPLALWARFVASGNGAITVRLDKAPSHGSENRLNGDSPGQTMTVTLPPGTPVAADYFVGDVLTGKRVKSEPLNLERLRPGTLLRLTVQPMDPGGNNRWVAQSVTWLQSITGSNRNPVPPPPPSITIPPAISPP